MLKRPPYSEEECFRIAREMREAGASLGLIARTLHMRRDNARRYVPADIPAGYVRAKRERRRQIEESIRRHFGECRAWWRMVAVECGVSQARIHEIAQEMGLSPAKLVAERAREKRQAARARASSAGRDFALVRSLSAGSEAVRWATILGSRVKPVYRADIHLMTRSGGWPPATHYVVGKEVVTTEEMIERAKAVLYG